MVQAFLPVVIDVLLRVVVTEPSTNRLSQGLRIGLDLLKIVGVPLLSVPETTLLRTRGTLESTDPLSMILFERELQCSM